MNSNACHIERYFIESHWIDGIDLYLLLNLLYFIEILRVIFNNNKIINVMHVLNQSNLMQNFIADRMQYLKAIEQCCQLH